MNTTSRIILIGICGMVLSFAPVPNIQAQFGVGYCYYNEFWNNGPFINGNTPPHGYNTCPTGGCQNLVPNTSSDMDTCFVCFPTGNEMSTCDRGPKPVRVSCALYQAVCNGHACGNWFATGANYQVPCGEATGSLCLSPSS